MTLDHTVETETLHTLLAEYPVTRAIHDGTAASPLIKFDFAPIRNANKGFKPFVRETAFDAGELAIATFLQAKDWGKPLVMLPATVAARIHHGSIAYNVERGELAPGDLDGKTVGVRAYTQTTGMWVRGVLQNQFGVDLTSIDWLTFEDAHVAEYTNPPYVRISDGEKGLADMLLDGELDAAILGKDMPDDPRIRRLIPDPEAAGRAWLDQNPGAMSLNHVVVVSEDLSRRRPDVVRALFEVFRDSKEQAGLKGMDTRPFGFDAIRPSLELAIDYCFQQGLIRRRMDVEDLFDDTTRAL